MQVTKEDIGMVIYGELADEITRGDDNLLEQKIAVGIGEIYGYLHRYDTDTIFADGWDDPFLKALCVNIIAWHLITLCSPNINQEVIRQNYEDATKYLREVQKGTVRPKWPLRTDDPMTPIDDAGNVQWSSNTKRRNHF